MADRIAVLLVVGEATPYVASKKVSLVVDASRTERLKWVQAVQKLENFMLSVPLPTSRKSHSGRSGARFFIRRFFLGFYTAWFDSVLSRQSVTFQPGHLLCWPERPGSAKTGLRLKGSYEQKVAATACTGLQNHIGPIANRV